LSASKCASHGGITLGVLRSQRPCTDCLSIRVLTPQHPRTVVFANRLLNTSSSSKLLSKGCVEIFRDEKHCGLFGCDWFGAGRNGRGTGTHRRGACTDGAP